MADVITMSMCGDVMTGRGIDQLLPHPSDPILYESFVKDARCYYEGISGYEHFRDDLGLIYLASIEPSTGKLDQLRMTPTQIRNMRVQRAQTADMFWLQEVLDRESRSFGIRVELIGKVLHLRSDV